MNTLLNIKNVSFAYGVDNVLENVSFKLKQDDFLAIIGPNGGGKSTLVKLILGLLKPQTGKITFAPNITVRHIGYVPQNTNHNTSFPICVADTIALGLFKPNILGFSIKKHRHKIKHIMEELHIAHLAKKQLNALSGGERQRVYIARALVGETKLLILDEPTANVDIQIQEDIYKLLKKLNTSISIIVISHDITLTLGYAKKVLYVNKYALTHDIPKCDIDFKQHICEVDILTYFAHSDTMHHSSKEGR